MSDRWQFLTSKLMSVKTSVQGHLCAPVQLSINMIRDQGSKIMLRGNPLFAPEWVYLLLGTCLFHHSTEVVWSSSGKAPL